MKNSSKTILFVVAMSISVISNLAILLRNYIELSNFEISMLVFLSSVVLVFVRCQYFSDEYPIVRFMRLKSLVGLNISELPVMLVFLPSLYALAKILENIVLPLGVDGIVAIASVVILAIFSILEFNRRIKF